MKKTLSLLLCLSFIFLSTSIIAQEICDNAIDDDNDGLIDLNDDDCTCESFSPSSLIPNPSFEEMECCPQGEAELNCASDWIQASTPTTDYYHTCGVLAHPFLGFMTPLPIADGEGCIGFRDGKGGVPNFKEYAGACLTQAMTIGTEYMLDFQVGFHDAPGSETLNMAVFATTDCSNLPFGNGDQNFGCPTNGPGWVQLGEMTYSGSNEWINVQFEFLADQAYEAIVLGPNCEINPDINLDPYFFFDNLILAESVMFGIPLMSVEGDICNNDLVLSSSDTIPGTYQWYKDGIALIGETNISLSVPNDGDAEGVYEIVVTVDEGCFNGEQYEVVVPEYSSEFEDDICQGGTYIFGDLQLTDSGVYEEVFTAADGCDSVVTLNLSVLDVSEESIFVEICAGDTYTLNDETFSEEGVYTQMLSNVDGCDSLLELNLNILDDTFGDIDAEICDGESYSLNNQTYTESGTYTQELINQNGCDSTLTLSLVVTENTSFTLEANICEGSSYTLNGEVYDEEGEYEQVLMGANGCDSILTLILGIDQVYFEDIFQTICQGESFELNDQLYTEEGIYEQELISNEGCDSILVIDITVLTDTEGSLSEQLCDGGSIEINGESFSEEGEFQQTLTGANGCDSILTINLSFFPVQVDTTEATICDTESFDFGGELLTESGTYENLLQNQFGCDSIEVLLLNVLPSFGLNVALDVCFGESIEYNGETFDQEGSFVQTLTAANGCDSTLFILVDFILGCDDCIYDEEAESRAMKMTIFKRNDLLFDVSITALEQQFDYYALSENRMTHLAALFAIEKVRILQNPQELLFADNGQLIPSTPLNRNHSYSAENIHDQFDLKGTKAQSLNYDQINWIFRNLTNMVEDIGIGKSGSYQ